MTKFKSIATTSLLVLAVAAVPSILVVIGVFATIHLFS